MWGRVEGGSLETHRRIPGGFWMEKEKGPEPVGQSARREAKEKGPQGPGGPVGGCREAGRAPVQGAEGPWLH